jgi:hypothetical protein
VSLVSQHEKSPSQGQAVVLVGAYKELGQARWFIPSYSGGGDGEDCGSRPAQAKSSGTHLNQWLGEAYYCHPSYTEKHK